MEPWAGNIPWLRACVVTLVVATVACACESRPLADEEGDDEGGGRAGTSSNGGGARAGSSGQGGTIAHGGTSAAGGSGADSNDCRIYAARSTETDAAMNTIATRTCSFDRASLTMRCEEDPDAFYTWTSTWPTIEAAVSENRPIGFHTASSTSVTMVGAQNCVLDYEVIHDELGRVTAGISTLISGTCNGLDSDYDAWDTQGRPTHGFENGVGANTCVGRNLTIRYDDANRTITHTRTQGTHCTGEGEITTRYDERGIRIVTESAYGDIAVNVLETAEICLN